MVRAKVRAFLKTCLKSECKAKNHVDFCTMHTDLNDEKVSKKLLLRQNGLHLNKKGLEFIVRYSPSPFLSAF